MKSRQTLLMCQCLGFHVPVKTTWNLMHKMVCSAELSVYKETTGTFKSTWQETGQTISLSQVNFNQSHQQQWSQLVDQSLTKTYCCLQTNSRFPHWSSHLNHACNCQRFLNAHADWFNHCVFGNKCIAGNT